MMRRDKEDKLIEALSKVKEASKQRRSLLQSS
jgi:hypothetical protein